MLSLIQAKLGNLVASTWAAEMTRWGERVKLYREYVDGEHRAKLTAEMRKMLRIADERTEHFNDNYCEMIVNTMVDRLTVTKIEGDSDDASAWSDEVLTHNRFDALQMDVHEAEVRDGDTFVMVDFDNEAQLPRLVHELAWDGDCGMLAVYDRMRRNIVAAIKVWYEGDMRWVNIYWPDRVEKYVYDAGSPSPLTPLPQGARGAEQGGMQGARGVEQGNMQAMRLRAREEEIPWVVDGKPLGVPVIHFRNRAKSGRTLGISEIAGAVPLQDALNRTLVSMVMTAELTAFAIRKAKGFDPPSNLAPGMWVTFGADAESADMLAAMDADMMKQGEIMPFISQGDWLINQMGVVTRTPLPMTMGGDNSSGEAIKQRETGLLGKIGRFHTKTGNSWEDSMALANRLATAFAMAKPPAAARWSTQWKDAQVRNDAEVITNALAVRELVGDREALLLIGRVYGYDEAKIDKILAEKQGETARRLQALNRNLPGFDRFETPSPPTPLPQGEGSQNGAAQGGVAEG